jgi:alginate O-acetyltransferase complex protein AlgI
MWTDRLGKKRYRALSENAIYIYFARGLTIAYFVLALTCLWTPELPQLISLMGTLGVLGLSGAFVTLATAFALSALALDTVSSRLRLRVSLAAIRDGVVVRNLGLAGKMMAVLAVATLFHKAPDFVYKAF